MDVASATAVGKARVKKQGVSVRCGAENAVVVSGNKGTQYSAGVYLILPIQVNIYYFVRTLTKPKLNDAP